jgi:HSP20 family molecular chaperone IbpA
MNKLFDEFFKEFFYSGEFDGVRRKREDGKLVMEIDVPGFNQDTLDVEYNKGYVTVKGDKEDRKFNKVFYMGNGYGIPQNANVKDGVLRLEFETYQQLEGQKVAIESG